MNLVIVRESVLGLQFQKNCFKSVLVSVLLALGKTVSL